MGITDELQYTPSEVVVHALTDLKKPRGLSFRELLNYAVVKHKLHQNSFKICLEHALRRGLKYKILDFQNGRYNLSHRLRQFLKKNKQKIIRANLITAKEPNKSRKGRKKSLVLRYEGNENLSGRRGRNIHRKKQQRKGQGRKKMAKGKLRKLPKGKHVRVKRGPCSKPPRGSFKLL